ncbi:MAG: hypothetical protein LW599_06530 [Rickettsiaceae bacterium]|nr:hypothetical protein [Rickettsiaceae bacterium]
MFLCDLLGLSELLGNNSEIKLRDTSYVYALINVLITNKGNLILEGNVNILDVQKVFGVSDRTNVLRILERLKKSKLIQYKISESDIKKDKTTVFLSIDKR